MRRPLLIAANWKMHRPPAGWDAAESPYRTSNDLSVAIFPTFLDLERCAKAGLLVGGQTGRAEPDGAFTGDISMAMLRETGATYVLCGHSERRLHHRETDSQIARQASAALQAGLLPIVCVGETAEERGQGNAEAVVRRQVSAIPTGVLLAYEPVWAIGTNKVATPEQAQQMHAFMRGLLPARLQKKTQILYGGSVNAENIKMLLAQADIDGALIGGCSLKIAEFAQILKAAEGVEKA